MSNSIILPMVNNAALLLSLSIIYEISYIFRLRLKRFVFVFNGILIGLIGIAIMSFPFILSPGLFFDTRTILIGVAALIFGLVPASIASVMTIFYRIMIGGIGALPGCATIAVSLVIGLLFRRFVMLERTRFRWLKLYGFGIIIHIAMLACMLLMPWDTALFTLGQISLPVMLIYPVVVVLLALLLLRQTEYNKAMTHVSEAESRYKSLFKNNHAVMLIMDPDDGQIVDVNPAAVRFYGWSEAELKAMTISQIDTMPEDMIRENLTRAVENSLHQHHFKHRLASNRTVDVEVYSGPIKIEGRTLLYSIIHDISSREAALSALRESEERFKLLVDNAAEAIFLMNDGNFALINKSGLTMLGAKSEEELLGRCGLTVIHPDYHPAVRNHMRNMREVTMTLKPNELVYVRPDGSHVNVETTTVPIVYKGRNAHLVIARDITERIRMKQKEREMEAQLRQQQKLEAIGTLAGGVAHEINNPLNGIMNYAQLILDASEAQSGNAEYAREIVRETERISVIVKNLLQFSRHEKQSHSYASIYDIIGQTISLVNTVIKKDQITLDLQLDEGLPEIKCRSQQIQQVIMNLLTNARDALNEKYRDYDENKIIRVRCSVSEGDGRRWLCLSVMDFGNGIQPELRDKIFEPFFSTKPKEIGTGLGLSISYGIVSEHHGTITFVSEPGKYTNFILYLPIDNGWML
jgi:PAS domain S-box-containing protein